MPLECNNYKHCKYSRVCTIELWGIPRSSVQDETVPPVLVMAVKITQSVDLTSITTNLNRPNPNMRRSLSIHGLVSV